MGYEGGHTAFLPILWWLIAHICWDSTQFLTKHLLWPKELFLVSTRGVFMCSEISSHFFSTLSYCLRGILLSLFILRLCLCHQHSPLHHQENAVLARILCPGCRETGQPNDTMLRSVFLGGLVLSDISRNAGTVGIWKASPSACHMLGSISIFPSLFVSQLCN